MDFNFFRLLSEFHFIRPELLLLLPVAIVFWLGVQRFSRSSEWLDYIPKEMLAVLQVQGTTQSAWLRWAWLVVWLIAGLAAAGPTWTKQSVPTMQNQNATVILLDLSPSMLAQDLSPDRLTRAKYKLIDILRRQSDGQAALIAYAGDAHTVSPLTDDPKTIEALLPALHPNIMPSQGSNTEAAVRLAQQLLSDAGVGSGQILLITDGVSSTAKTVISKELSSNNLLSILAVGSNEAAPIPTSDGGFVRSSSGEIVLSKVARGELRTLANQFGGRFASLSNDDSDLNRLLSNDFESGQQDATELNNSYDAWADMGHWLVLLILPLFTLFFRKGFIYCLPLLFLLPINSEAADSEPVSSWSKLWQTPDQQAAELLNQQQYEQAAETFKREDWSAIADYKNGNYQSAADKLADKDDITSLYNRANSLAFAGELEKARDVYKAVLAKQADHADALHNKEVIQKLLDQQQEQKQEGEDSSEQEQDSEKQESDSEDSQSQDSQSQDSEQSESQDQQQQSQDDSQPEQQSEQDADEQASEDEESQAKQEPSANDEQEPSASDEQEPSASDEQEPSASDEQEPSANDEQAAQQEEQQNESESEQQREAQATQTQLEESPEQLKDSSEQWLRGIQEDPSGLLRRKFEYQNWLREQQGLERSKTGDQERY